MDTLPLRFGSASCFVLLLIGVLSGGGAATTTAEGTSQRGLAAHPSRIIVQYRDTIDVCAHCLLARQIPFATVTGRVSLDRLHRELGVHSARPLFFADESGSGRSRAFHNRLKTVESRFTARAARAPAGATFPNLANYYVIDLPAGIDPFLAAAEYGRDPDVASAEVDARVQISQLPNDPLLGSLWNLTVPQAPTAWDTSTGQGMVIAVVDTGVDETHPDLTANVWSNTAEIAGNGMDDDGNGYIDDTHGWDFVDNDATPHDENGHGTHVAGIAGATGNNGIGIVGMAPGARVMPVRGLDATGSGYESDLAAAIVYAAQNGADVINNSWGGLGVRNVMRDAVGAANTFGAVVVAAAGNSASAYVENVEPAGVAQVIAVSATDRNDHPSSFSNWGSVISVAAPGEDILSLKARDNQLLGNVVDDKYLRLSGTSMASPHVAGVAALLLAAQPALTPEQLRWQIELNADQLGATGYETAPWNPYLGWGRINAARVFDAVPVTTRLRPFTVAMKRFGSWHGFTGETAYTPDFLDLAFTTTDPVDWTLSTPAWVNPSKTAGSGPAHFTFTLDATGLAPGTYSDALTVHAQAPDGGGSVPVTAVVHRDERLGAEVRVPLTEPYEVTSNLRALSIGPSSLLVWSGHTIDVDARQVWATLVDGAGSSTPPVRLSPPATIEEVALAADGRNFLAVWLEYRGGGNYAIQGARVAADGTPVDQAPLLIASDKVRNASWHNLEIGFDGSAYSVVWTKNNYGRPSTVYLQRFGVDGSVRGKRVQLYPNRETPTPRYLFDAHYGCNLTGVCLLAWEQSDAPYTYNAHALRVRGTTLLDAGEPQVAANIIWLKSVNSNGRDFFLAGWRSDTQSSACANGFACDHAIGARITAEGTALDPDGIQLDRDTPEGFTLAEPEGVTFDGTHWVATIYGRALGRGVQMFAARVDNNGQVVDQEPLGLLLHGAGTGGGAAIAATPSHHVFAWRDSRQDTAVYPSIFYDRSVWFERVLAHATVPAIAERHIGAIGALSTNERTPLTFTVVADALNRDLSTYEATALPDGAVFDAATRTFYWQPSAAQGNTQALVHFAAGDGTANAAEDVAINVNEAVLALGGVARLGDGSPVAGVALEIHGATVRGYTAQTNSSGGFRFEDLPAGTYSIKVAKQSLRQYRGKLAAPVTLGSHDVDSVDLVLTPKQ